MNYFNIQNICRNISKVLMKHQEITSTPLKIQLQHYISSRVDVQLVGAELVSHAWSGSSARRSSGPSLPCNQHHLFHRIELAGWKTIDIGVELAGESNHERRCEGCWWWAEPLPSPMVAWVTCGVRTTLSVRTLDTEPFQTTYKKFRFRPNVKRLKKHETN